MKDALGDRMKSHYENATRIYLPRRTYTIIRVDGKAFHTYTKKLAAPFDDGLMEDMDTTAKYLCKNVMGVKLAFVQSDEITLVLTDFETESTQGWFDGNLQKMASVSASMATRAFNEARMRRIMAGFSVGIGYSGTKNRTVSDLEAMKWAEFDSRVFQVPSRTEVINCLIWRQQDATRNSIQSVARSIYSHKDCDGKNTDQLQEIIFKSGRNWNDYAPRYKRGRIILKETYVKEVSENEKSQSAVRTRWIMVEPPIFTQDREFLEKLIPKNE